MIGPKNMHLGIILISLTLVGVLFLPVEFVISAIIFTLVVRGGLNLLRLAEARNEKSAGLDET